MSLQLQEIAAGTGWRARRFICQAGPEDAPFEEQHGSVSIAIVTRGSFEYRSEGGTATLVPGALLLGNPGQCYRCAHHHGRGDDCIAFQYDPEFWEETLAARPAAGPARFKNPSHPPDWVLTRLLAEIESATAIPDARAMEELAIRLSQATLARHAGTTAEAPATARDHRRVGALARWIEEAALAGEEEGLGLADLARQAGMSRFHLLRLFRQVTGQTPHQFLLRLRMHRAALSLRNGDHGIATIAFEAGFGDLSTFNRQFRRVFGTTPGAFRKGCAATPFRVDRA